MAETATEIITIDAPHERVWQIALDLESYPMWAHDIKDVNIRATDDLGRPLEVEFRASALGRSTHYTLKYDYTSAPFAMGWTMLTGDIQRSIDGVWRFDPDGGDRIAGEIVVSRAEPTADDHRIGIVEKTAKLRFDAHDVVTDFHLDE